MWARWAEKAGLYIPQEAYLFPWALANAWCIWTLVFLEVPRLMFAIYCFIESWEAVNYTHVAPF